MTQEEKQLVLKDLCGRLLYHVMVEYRGAIIDLTQYARSIKIEDCKPYLRPMSSMTEEECKILGSISATLENKLIEVLPNIPYYIEVAVPDQIDWLNEHHFDYRGLIEKGLALEAPKGMYKTD